MKWIKSFAATALILAAALISGCSEDSNPLRPAPGADEFDADLAVGWMDLTTDLVKAEKWTPPTASRLYGYAGVTLYESVVHGMPNNLSLVGQLNELEELPAFGDAKYHWPTVANAAMATFLRSMFANGSAASLDAITAMEQANYSEPNGKEEEETFSRSIDQGKLLGLAIFGWALNDGYPLLNNCSFTPPTGAGKWVPTPPAFAAPLQPCWGDIRPFVMTSGTNCMPGPPPTFSETVGTPFYIEMQEVYETASNLTTEQRAIADFWADNPGQTSTPPGHSISITGQVLTTEGKTLGFAAETYAKVGMAVADAFIGCWKTKFEYNLIRPVSCIREVFQADWNSPIATPAFPEYTSGHSVQSSATAAVLTSIFGENYAFTDHTHDGRGLPARSFASFSAYAQEAAISRLYGGIHFRSAIEVGLDQGECIAAKILAVHFEK
jgi:hypothetical protein